jgi:hypothetical protein
MRSRTENRRPRTCLGEQTREARAQNRVGASQTDAATRATAKPNLAAPENRGDFFSRNPAPPPRKRGKMKKRTPIMFLWTPPNPNERGKGKAPAPRRNGVSGRSARGRPTIASRRRGKHRSVGYLTSDGDRAGRGGPRPPLAAGGGVCRRRRG